MSTREYFFSKFKAYIYEPDSEEGSMQADLTSSINSGPDDTDGTVTPTISKRLKKYSDLSLISDESSGSPTRFMSELEKEQSTESEYFTAKSGFTTDSNASSNNN